MTKQAIDYLEKTYESFNSSYNLYRAKWCKASALPMYSKKDFHLVEKQKLYSRARAKKEKIQIDDTKVYAWYRMFNGYIPLFKIKGE